MRFHQFLVLGIVTISYEGWQKNWGRKIRVNVTFMGIFGKRHSAWLFYALLCVVWWGVWGFLSKLGSDRASPQQLQVLFTIGIIPPSVLAWAQLGFKVETD